MQRRVVVTPASDCVHRLDWVARPAGKLAPAGQSGINSITHFDHSQFTTATSVVKSKSDPTTFIDKRGKL
ncbi:MAG: hypothetical protein U0787_05480 [Polyangia bacterium]